VERLERSAVWARITVAIPTETLVREASKVARSVEGDSAVRVLVMRAARVEGVALARAPTHRLVFAEPLTIRVDDYARGISACVLPDALHGTLEAAHAKYARYLPRLLARDEARARGFDDALLADESGTILSGSTASVFAVGSDGIITSTVLEGITRATVVGLARGLGLPVSLRPIERGDIERATEVFLTSSLREIVPVVRVDDHVVGTGAPGRTTRDLHAALRALAGASGPPPWAM
jgi:branched-chain amino acid aminotransferase